jgi:gamma-glutamyl-gamma-aminobutyrate hydrolase PuuD
MRKNLYWVGGGTGQTDPFTDLFKTHKEVTKKEDMTDPDSVLVLWGGDDISPSLYGHLPGKHTNSTTNLSSQDKLEMSVFLRAVELNIPILGICRGAQLACALSGGTLYQHVDNHEQGHNVECSDLEGKVTIMHASSIHHQMMNPTTVYHKVLAVASPKLSQKHFSGGNDMDLKVEYEPEVVFFPHTQSLAIQPHPEFMNPSSAFVEYSRMLTKKLLIAAPC